MFSAYTLVHRVLRVPRLDAFAAAIVFAAFPASADPVIDGLSLTEDGSQIVTVSGSFVSGEIEVPHEDFTGNLAVTFLQPGGAPYVPVAGDSLKWQFADGSLVAATRLGAFSFRLEGLIEGKTTANLILWVTDHAAYTSPAVDVHVHEGHAEADGLVLRKNGNVLLALWQGIVTGSPVNVPFGGQTDPITVTFLDPDSLEFTPDPEMTLVTEVADPTDLAVVPTGDWEFRLQGLAVGPETFTICIFHVDHCDFTSADLPVSVLSGATDAPVLVSATPLQLFPPSPNPVTHATQIELSLPREAVADLAVYDVQGRRVASLAAGTLAPGRHVLEWTPDAIPNGVFFVRLESLGATRTRKVVLSR